MDASSIDDLMDRLVADYADRVQRGEAAHRDDLLDRVPPEHRTALARCFRMIEEGSAAVPDSPAPLGPGSELGGYRIQRIVGRGGMATVYRAEQPELDRIVALKVLRPGLAVDRRHVARFRGEAQAVARLQHQHILAVHAVGEDRGFHFIAMEFVDGPSLADVLSSLPAGERWTAGHLAEASGLPELAEAGSYERALATLLAPVVRAIGVAHDLGIVHRDIKPSNILIQRQDRAAGRQGRAVVADFGLAKADTDLALSLTGEPLGTPYYMAPEQVAHASDGIDARTDVYGLGVTLYEALAGRRPFAGDSLMAVFDAIRSQTPAPLRALASDRSRDAQDVVARAMARDRNDRYRSALELAADLEALASGRPTQAGAERGGLLRRVFAGARRFALDEEFTYVSPQRLFGLPLVHVTRSRRRGERMRVAKGWLAVGNVAVGFAAFGSFTLGVLSTGVMSLGLLAVGGAIGVGGVGVGGGAGVGGLGLGGGIGIGYYGIGGGVGMGYGAFGGYARGVYAMGGKAVGEHTVSAEGVDPEALAWFDEHLPWVADYHRSLVARSGVVLDPPPRSTQDPPRDAQQEPPRDR